MLTEPEQLLIAAAVDGPLPPAEAKALDRLLAAKPEAAVLLRRLKANAVRLAALPKRRAPHALAAKVMARVRPIAPARKPTPARRSLLPFAIAASLFLAVTAGSFLFFNGTNATSNEQAQRNQLPPAGAGAMPADVPTVESVAFAKPGAGEDGKSKPAADDGAFAKRPPAEPPATVVVQAPKPLTPEEIELIGSALMIESKPLKQIDPTLPLLFSGLDLDKDDPQARMKKELARDAGFRLNLFSKNTVAAVEQVQAAAKSVGVHVFVEGNTAERMKKPTPPLAYAVYVENLTADDLAALFAALSKQVNGQSRPETVLGSAHFIPADANEQKDLKELLGMDWPQARAAKPDAKSVSEGTLKEVVASVKKPGDKAAVVVTYAARLNAGKSSEAKQFVEKRGERKPGTVPVLIVIRPQG